ncbi:GntR family transcriptional regulator [uncultured Propionibacterium sp.]|uniref:GntR family transcriptional regulator n=1 Tax=uncultured Propionibacterium sp. TaxID=218066 RepID=UPI00292D1AC3|nr:GntR family transcriptional regulator [uncultured Propionibacterium sp.]
MEGAAREENLDVPFVPRIMLDRESSVPLYQQIAGPIEELIMAGELAPGRLIEDEVSMAKRLKVSRPTTRRALRDLVMRGLLTRRRGIGTRVTPMHVHRSLGLTSLNDDLIAAGFHPRTEVLSYEVMLADPTAARSLHGEPGIEIIQVRRLRFIDDEPLAIMTNLLPAGAKAPTVTQLTGQGLYESLAVHGTRPVMAQQSIGARLASPEEARLLVIDEGDAVLVMERTAFDKDGSVIEHGTHVYNCGMYSFQFNLVADA